MIDFKIAILESEPERLQMMQEAIADTFPVTPFTTGESFLQKVKQTNFDLAIIDMNLSDISGQQLQEKLAEVAPNIKSVLLSGVDRSRATVASMRKRAMDYLYRSNDYERFHYDVCRLVRYLIDDNRREKAEGVLKETGLLPIVQRLYDDRTLNVEQLKKEIQEFKNKK